MVAVPNTVQRTAISMIDSTSVAGTLEEIPSGNLRIDHEYQRSADEARVRKIANNFDPELFGVLLVSRRRDGSLWVMDGQHRLLALRAMGKESERVPCLVYEGLLLEDEARIFYEPQTTRKALSPGQRFKARLISNDAMAIRMVDIVEELGFHLNLRDGETSGGRLCAIGTVDWVLRQYGAEGLTTVLKIIHDAWAGETSGITASVLKGMAQFVAKYRGQYDHVHLVSSLRKAVDPHRIETDGIALRRLTGSTTEDAVGMTILRIYNYKKTTRRLPEWTETVTKRRSN